MQVEWAAQSRLSIWGIAFSGVFYALRHGFNCQSIECMTSRTNVIHICLGVATVPLSELEQIETFTKTIDHYFSQASDFELFLLRVFNDRQRLLQLFKCFMKQVEDLVIIDLEVRTTYHEKPSLFLILDLIKQLSQTVQKDTLLS